MSLFHVCTKVLARRGGTEEVIGREGWGDEHDMKHGMAWHLAIKKVLVLDESRWTSQVLCRRLKRGHHHPEIPWLCVGSFLRRALEGTFRVRKVLLFWRPVLGALIGKGRSKAGQGQRRLTGGGPRGRVDDPAKADERLVEGKAPLRAESLLETCTQSDVPGWLPTVALEFRCKVHTVHTSIHYSIKITQCRSVYGSHC
jgi:hypothetical protein